MTASTLTKDSLPGHTALDTQPLGARQGAHPDSGQVPFDIQGSAAAVGTSSPQASSSSTPMLAAPAGDSFSAAPASVLTLPKGRALGLLDPLLNLAAITLDDLENLRTAQENRYRSLTQTGVSDNGLEWGYGLDDRDPQVAQAGAMVDAIAGLEHTATLNLQRLMRRHPLGPWVKAQRGIGEKQAARLLAAIGDPYWNTLHDRPRTVSELWAYSGLHTLPASQMRCDAQCSIAGGDTSSTGGDHHQLDTQEGNVAARRRKGVKANWSTNAKTRAWLCIESCLKQIDPDCKTDTGIGTHVDCHCSPYRVVIDQRRTKTVGRLHATPCHRCGPKGKPALAGTPWNPGHSLADAMRIASKELLKDLWCEARRIHEQS